MLIGISYYPWLKICLDQQQLELLERVLSDEDSHQRLLLSFYPDIEVFVGKHANVERSTDWLDHLREEGKDIVIRAVHSFDKSGNKTLRQWVRESLEKNIKAQTRKIKKSSGQIVLSAPANIQGEEGEYTYLDIIKAQDAYRRLGYSYEGNRESEEDEVDVPVDEYSLTENVLGSGNI